MKRLFSFVAALLLVGALGLADAAQAAKPAQATGQIRKIKLRMQRAFLAGKPSDAEVATLLKELEADGSFAGIDYDDAKFNTGGAKNQHLVKLSKLAKAYATTPGTYYKNRELYDAITRSLGFWLDRNPEDKNWWHRIIGFPKQLMVPLTLLADDMKRYDKALYARCLDYELYSWSIPKQRAQDGANGTDICKFTFAAAVLSENEELLREVMDKVNSLIKIARADREEGIQPDFSYTQHNGSGRQLYLATYGREYVDGIIYFMDFVKDTDFWFRPEQIDLFERLFLDGLAWTWYAGELDVNQYGRGLLRSSMGPSYLNLAQQLAAFGTPRSEELKQLVAFMKGQQELNGNRMFPRTDYMIHRPAGAMISTRMTSVRTVGNEAGNGEGLFNYHTGDGANYIKVHGNEYNPILAGWNWRRIPGTTVLADERPMPAPMWGAGGQGGSDYAGGASDGRRGVCAFIYAKDSLEAHKAWFYFDRYFVALGAGIASERTDAPAVTTVNQTLLSGKTTLRSGDTVAELNGTAAAFDRLWHYDVGYRFEPGTVPTAAVYKAEYPADYTGRKNDILRIEIDHGTAPQQGSYAYGVYPNISRDAFLACGEDYRILSNTVRLQAVQDTATGQILAACYEAGSFPVEGLGTVAVDASCLLIVEPTEGTVRVSVGTPFCESRPLEAVAVAVGKHSGSVAVGTTAEL